ncbi:hypothetical protein LUZ60_016253 [Juncus effusus]|nr:hypothetical protein LUZ60_016253 [Juncus effusus]
MANMDRAHVILFPFLAQGHITPFLCLSEKLQLQNPNLTITLVSTPKNINSISSSLPSDSHLHLHSIPFSPESFGLPPNTESMKDLPFQLLINLFQASESLKPAFEDFVSGLDHPVYIITDFFLSWTCEVARKFKALHSVFLTLGAYATAVYFSLWSQVPLSFTPFNDEISLREFPHIKIQRTQCTKHLSSSDGMDAWASFIKSQIKFVLDADVILINTVEELEASGLKMVRGWFEMPICPVGPLLSINDSSSSINNDNYIIKWLESKPPSSVLYISFGSQYTLQPKQMMELAFGLESSGKNFIWVIRPPAGFDVKGEFRDEWLPTEFEERMKRNDKGMLVHSWAPQVDILAHDSTGAFLSHCGWNSVLESLSFGVPIIGWPLSADQFYNSKSLVENLGVCTEIARGNDENSIVEKEEIKKVIEMVMGESGKGKKMRERAKEMKERIKMAWKKNEGSSETALFEFFATAKKCMRHKEKKHFSGLGCCFFLT